MKYEPDSVCRRDSVAMLSATKRIPTVAIRKPSHEPLPARPATTAMLRAGVSVGAMFATDWPMQSTRPSALARSWGRSAALASAAPSASGPGGVIRVRTSMGRSARHSPCNVAQRPMEFAVPPPNKKGCPAARTSHYRGELKRKETVWQHPADPIDEIPFTPEGDSNDRLRIGFRDVELGDRRRARQHGRARAHRSQQHADAERGVLRLRNQRPGAVR